MAKQTLEQASREYVEPRRGHQDQYAEMLDCAFKAGAAWGLRHAAWLCRYEYETMSFARNEAARQQAMELENSCIATAGRISRGEYENPTSETM